MSDFTIDPDIHRARTLSSSFYTEGRYFELSKERIFSRTWQFAGRADEVENLKPVTLLPGFLDEPILLSKNDDGIRCMSNVCTHRGKILVDESCNANLIRCGYHGRRFDLNGKFLSMPEFADVENFPSEADNLKQIPIATRGGFVFASVDPIAPFADFVDDVATRFNDLEPSQLKLVSKRDYEVKAHWALYCENYLEGFHIPFVHHSLNEIVDYGSYSTETFRYSSLQTGLDAGGAVAGRYLFIFPNLMFNFYPWGISVNVVRPVTPSRSVVEFLTYVSDESKLGSGAGTDLDRVELEDEAVVESVQRGIRSRFYSHGRYSPTREQGTHHFHRLIAEFME
ncbi:MAG: choline monooxygenase [Acidobacteria bacterium]|nr:MAG: choline monooxygenase [Acidobacteriota bacterium]